jgi:diaminopropionate ammonia-lyase
MSLPPYRATPLLSLSDLAHELRVGALAVKNEELRLGVPSFKLLGSAWAVHELIRRQMARPDGDLLTLAEMREEVRAAPATLCTASDGNYGRSIAALAEMLGCDSLIFLPADTVAQRIADVRAHGARVELVDGSYEQTVTRARAEAARYSYWYCPDTALSDAHPSELVFVRDVTDGYTTLFVELVGQLGNAPDVLFVQAGVGGLAAAGVLALSALAPNARIVTVEPEASNCVQASIAAGEPRSVPDLPTMMAGLRCQSVSAAAWPLLRSRVAAAVTISDGDAADAMRTLAAHGVVAGEAGAAGLAGARIALRQPEFRARLGIDGSSVVATVNTEGATDRVNYERIVADR